MSNKYYITTPIYYVNAKPHIGHTYTTVSADILARYHKLINKQVFFLTGTDEHGAKISEKAQEENINPQEFTDKISIEFQNVWKKLNISHDNFIRTTDDFHIKSVQNALQYMYDKGDIFLDKYEGLYCQGCEQYKNQKDLQDGKCPDHKTKPEKMNEETYLFRMEKYAQKLLDKIEKDEIKIRPISKKNEIIKFYQQGLKNVSFSRQNVSWGIPLPWDKSHTAYVWSDAFLNYLTGLKWDGANKPSEMFPPDMQLMSKDIIRVHATIWLAMLLSLDLPLPKNFFVHGFFLIDGQKMSKSIGNIISPLDLIEKYGPDATRYLLISATPFGHDGDISWEKFDEKYNADLANGLGNLVARVSNMLEKNEITVSLKILSDSFLDENTEHELTKKFILKMNNIEIDQALKVLWDELRKNDEILTKKAPWKIKDKKEVKKILEPIAQSILDVTFLLQPFMPEIAKNIINQFQQTQIKKEAILFQRIT